MEAMLSLEEGLLLSSDLPRDLSAICTKALHVLSNPVPSS